MHATRSDQIPVKLLKLILETGCKRFYLVGAKTFSAQPPEVRAVRYGTVFSKASEEHFNQA